MKKPLVRELQSTRKNQGREIDLDVPSGNESLCERMPFENIVFAFNEGYNSSHPDILFEDCVKKPCVCVAADTKSTTNILKQVHCSPLMCLQASRFDPT